MAKFKTLIVVGAAAGATYMFLSKRGRSLRDKLAGAAGGAQPADDLGLDDERSEDLRRRIEETRRRLREQVGLPPEG